MSETDNTNTSSDLSSMQERNSQLLSDIQNLQKQEQNLYNELQDKASSNTLTDDIKTKITSKINDIFQIRMNLYQSLKDTFSLYESNASSSATTLAEQKYAIDIIEKQLKVERGRLIKLQETKSNKLRMVEFNSSYAAQYQAQTNILKTIALWCLPLIVIIVISNQGIISSNVANVLIAVVMLIAGSIIVLMILDSLNRDNMNYNEYNWFFNPNNVDTSTNDTSVFNTTTSNPWVAPVVGTCVGQDCCSDNQTFNADTNKCEDNVINTTQEAFISNNLSKYAMNPPLSGTISVNNKVEGFSHDTSNYVSF